MMNYLRGPIISTLFCGVNAYFVRYLRRLTHTTTALPAVQDLRKEYSKKGLLESTLPEDPYNLFKDWFKEACDSNVLEPNAMCLSTCKDNMPSARYVLLKAFDENGFVWYTNYQSRKSNELEENPNAALTFWWGALERSIRIEGKVEKVSSQESSDYFNSRPRGSQIGAWTSSQSKPIESRQVLEQQEKKILEQFQDESQTIPKPDHWGGFRLYPSKIEFWKGREGRLHDRILFTRQDSSDLKTPNTMSTASLWSRTRLQP